MAPTKHDLDALYLDRIRRARQMSPREKFYAGARLFDFVCRNMRAGIRHDFPDADDAKVEEILRQRLALSRQLEESR